MNLIFKPALNFVIRHALRPFASIIPPDFHPRVTGTFTIRVDDETRFQMAVNPTSYLGKVLFFRGVRGYEWDSVRVFIALARRSRCFLDVGANIGYYSLVASAVNPALRVVSFEPLPSAYHFLKKNLDLNGFTNVTPSRLALSREAGRTQFFVSKDPTFLEVEHHLTTTGGFNQALSSRTRVVEAIEVETDTMDHYVETHLPGVEVDLVKLDTESSEHLVLQGAAGVLSRHRPTIFCEVLPDTIEDELEALFRQHGYLLFRVKAEGLVRTEHLRHGDRADKDHIMVHPDRLPTVSEFVLEG